MTGDAARPACVLMPTCRPTDSPRAAPTARGTPRPVADRGSAARRIIRPARRRPLAQARAAVRAAMLGTPAGRTVPAGTARGRSPQDAIGVSVHLPPETASTWIPKIDGPPIGNQASGVGVARYWPASSADASAANDTPPETATYAPSASRNTTRQLSVAPAVSQTAPSRISEAPSQG